MAKSQKDKTVSIRLSELMLEALDARAVLEEKDRTQVIRDAISRYLEFPEDSVEDKLQILEKEQVSLNIVIEKLRNHIQNQARRTDSIEVRVDELGKIMAGFMDKSH